MTRLDLDAVQARNDDALRPSNIDGSLDDAVVEARWWASAKDVPALVAELRAARHVILARKHGTAADVEAALAAYDVAIGGAQP